MPYLRRRTPITHKITFTDVALNFTFACNLSCVGCDRASFVKPQHSPPMTPDRLRSFFDEVRSVGIELKGMRMVGGEPTLHPQFMEMAGICMDYARSTDHRCGVRIFSNQYSEASRKLLAEALQRWPKLRSTGEHKLRSWTFPPMTRYEFVSPQDAGVDCRYPCPNMAGRGNCGAGVDQVGYALCPTGSVIDAILKLGARATSVRQMLDPEFIRHQAEVTCSRCGNFMAYQQEDLPQLWYCNGTPVSKTYRNALVAADFQVTEFPGG
jgi:hypothetical protein